MHVIFVIGRILFVLIFIVAGAGKLMDIPTTTAVVASKFAVPGALADYASQAEAATGMKTAQMLAILAGVIELVGGLLIVFNIGTRWVSFILFVYTLVVTIYVHNFWSMEGVERAANMTLALKNVTLMGGLLMLFALGGWRPARGPGGLPE